MSLEKKIKSKTFIIVNILLFIVLAALMNIDKIVLFFGGNFDKQNNIMIVDNTNKTYEIFKNTLDSCPVAGSGYEFLFRIQEW